MTAFSIARRATLAAAVLFGLGMTASLTGCSAPQDTPGTQLTTSSSSTESANATTTPAATAIVLDLDGRIIQGHLTDNPTARALVRQLPLTLSFRDYGGQEKIAPLPESLDLDGAPKGSAAPALTIGYYAPDQSLVLYYDDVGYFSGIVPIGTYENAVGTRTQPDTFPVTIRLDK